MGCRSDYMEPNASEVESKHVATLLLYVLAELKQTYVPDLIDELKETANDVYGNLGKLDTHTSWLCEELGNMSEENKDKIIYNGRNKVARQLADWWDKHQEADKKRERKEMKEKGELKEIGIALDKLTPRERELLKVPNYKIFEK